MSYEIKKSDGNVLVTVPDGVLDTETTSINLIGKNVENFGIMQNENFLHMLEHFSRDTAPDNPITGQLWFNSTVNKLFVYSQGTFNLLGPEKAAGFSDTKLYSLSITDTNNVAHPIIQIIINGEIIAIISGSEFTINTGTPISGFTTIYRGITMKNYGLNLSDVQIYGKITNASTAATAVSATTTSVTDASNNIATTQFVHSVIPTGVILMWSGTYNTIPTGWALCNGTNGTPNLVSKFVLGASDTVLANTTGGSTTSASTLETSGVHAHDTITGNTALTEAQMPAHNHLLPGDDFLSVGDGIAGWTARYAETVPYDARSITGSGVTGFMWRTSDTGSGASHAHEITADGVHTHIMNALPIMPPWYALCYIMKTT